MRLICQGILIAQFLLVITASQSIGKSSGFTQIKTDQNLAYKPASGPNKKTGMLDIYYRDRSPGKRLMVFVHGGSWVGGDKTNLQKAQDMIAWFLQRGYVVAAPNFKLAAPPRMSRGPGYVNQARDIAQALAWLRKHASSYGVTKSEIVLVGYSSGAHLVALLATDERYLKEVGLSHHDLAAVVSLDVHAYDVPFALKLMQNNEYRRNIPLILSVFGKSKKQQLAGSPASYIHKADVPPSLIISADLPRGTSKGYIAGTASSRYASLLKKYGHTAQAIHFKNETHSSLVLDFGYPGDGPTQAVESFLNKRISKAK